jgi:S1-C subfamily serine protease
MRHSLHLGILSVWLVLILALAGCGPALDQSALPVPAENIVVLEDVTEAQVVVPVKSLTEDPAQAIVSDIPVGAEGQTAVPTLDLYAAQDILVNLYERVNPAVVNIRVKTASSGQNLPDNLPENHPFFGPQYGQGSGFVYDLDGHIITNNHVVGSAEQITVIFADGAEVDATLVGTDPDSDLAVIKVDLPAERLTAVPIGDSNSLKVGQYVIAIGNPFGLDGSMTSGIISGLSRTLPSDVRTAIGNRFSIPNIIQTDAAINPGNSGGPLLNLAGEVIGVNTAIATNDGTFSGVGYAVPAATVQRVVPQLIAQGEIRHPWIGISGREMNRALAEAMGLEADQRGVLVVETIANGPAAKAGVRGSNQQVTIDGAPVAIGGDIIVTINDQPITVFDTLLSYIVQRTAVGETVTLTVLRNGELIDLPLTLEARPSN